MSERTAESAWNAAGRVNAARKWRAQSAAMGRHMTEAIVAEAHVEPGMQVLDVGCGTGEPAISIAEGLRGAGQVLGIDISTEALKLAEQRAQEKALSNLRFRQADVHHLPFSAASFDRVTSRLSVMFFADTHRALCEICRVLKPEGRATLLTWGPMAQPYFESTAQTILRLLPGSRLPDAARSMFRFGEPGVLTNALKQAGFRTVREQRRTIPWSWPGTPAEVWEYFRDVTVPFRELIDAVPVERQGEITAHVLQAIERYWDGRQVNFTATVNLVTASPT